MNYLVYDPISGEVIRLVSCPPEIIDLQIQPGESVLEGEVIWGQQYVLNGVLTNYTPEQAAAKAAAPKYPASWSNTTFTWTDLRTLDDQKTDRWNILKAQRDQKLYEPLTTPYGVFDCDQRSQKNITDAIQLLQTLEAQQSGQTIEFTLYDNTTVTLTTQQMVNVGLALGQRTQQVYATSRQLREQLDQAQSKQEVEAISWPQ